jgi:phosphohistidine phosphatase
MLLYLVRHGQAESKEVDAERGLTARGAADVRRMAEHLRRLNLSVAEVWHSEKKRARQTAELLAPALLVSRGLVERDGLTPNAAIVPIAKEMSKLGEDLMIVGHMPFQSLLAGRLLTGRESDGLNFATAAVACLERGDDGTWRLLWMIEPDLLP